MNSKIIFGQYYNADSWIHRLDPRTKILSVIIFMIGIFFIESIYILLGLFLGIALLVITSKIPLGKFLKSIQMVTYLLLFAFICQVLFRKTGEVLTEFSFTLTVLNLTIGIVLLVLYFLSGKIIKKFRLTLLIVTVIIAFLLQVYLKEGILITNYKITIYKDSISSALFIMLRIILILLMSSLMTLSTKPTDLNNGLEKLLAFLKVFKINPAIIAMIISIALREIPKLINEANKVLKAQASRGVDFKEAKFKEKVMQIISLIVPMFIISYQIAGDLSDAMEARGYDPDQKRTTINILKMHVSDIFSLTIMLILFAASIVLKVIL